VQATVPSGLLDMPPPSLSQVAWQLAACEAVQVIVME